MHWADNQENILYGEDKFNINYTEFLLAMLTDEMNRSRDWPIRILGFTSALHFAVITGILISNISFIFPVRCLLTIFFSLLFAWSAYYFWKCHINYLKARNSQINLEKQIGIADMGILPDIWLKARKISGYTATWGWGFYVFVAAGFWLATIGVLWFKVVATK